MFLSRYVQALRFAALLIAILLLAPVAPVQAQNLQLGGNLIGSCGTATATAGAATLNNKCGVVTSESLTTGRDSDYTLTLTNSVIASGDIVLASVKNGTNTTGNPIIAAVTPGSASATIKVTNRSSGSPLGGTIIITYFVIKAGG